MSRTTIVAHDCYTKVSQHILRLICVGGLRQDALPARSPDLSAFVERWIRTVKDECLGKLIFFGQWSAERALNAYVEHHYAERNHHGIGNVIPLPRAEALVVRRTSPGGLLNFYVRNAG